MTECAFVKGKDCYSWCKAYDNGKCLRLLPAKVEVTGSMTVDISGLSDQQLNTLTNMITRDLDEKLAKVIRDRKASVLRL